MKDEDFIRMEQEATKKKAAPKDVMTPYIGMWLKEECGNVPAALFHPDFVEKAQKLAEREYPGQYIFATVQVAERNLITRSSLRAIKNYAASLLQKLLARQNTETVVTSSSGK